MKKKIISLCLVIALVATAIAGATLAYFTDYTDDVVNTFTFGNIDIKLDEAKVGDDGQAPNHDDRVIKNEYKDIYPGLTVDKDPTVTVKAGSESCYVRMFVTVDQKMLEEAFTGDAFASYWLDDIFLLEKLVLDEDGKSTWNRDVWKIQDNVEIKDGKATYEFWYKEAVEEDDEDTVLDDLFQKITFPTALTNDQVAKLAGFQVDVYAEAIQFEGFKDAADAWNSFVKGTQQVEATEATVETTEVPDTF